LGINGATNFKFGNNMAERGVDDCLGEKNRTREASAIGREAFVKADGVNKTPDEKRAHESHASGIDVRARLEDLGDGFDKVV
jgi:hypothetical protein